MMIIINTYIWDKDWKVQIGIELNVNSNVSVFLCLMIECLMNSCYA